MQLLSAFSRPQTLPAVPVKAPKKTLWILNSWRDLILYVGTPLLLLPIFLLAQRRWNTQDIYLFVSAFGAMGHHLPGMIRAYGDPALFTKSALPTVDDVVVFGSGPGTDVLQGVVDNTVVFKVLRGEL